MKQKTPKSSLKILDQTFPLHARVRALSLFWSSLTSPLSTMQLPIFRCVYPTWADNECACLAPSLPLSLSLPLLTASIENNNCQVDDNNGRLQFAHSPKKERKERRRARKEKEEKLHARRNSKGGRETERGEGRNRL